VIGVVAALLGLAYLAKSGSSSPLAPAAKEGALEGLMVEQQQQQPPPQPPQQQVRGLPEDNGQHCVAMDERQAQTQTQTQTQTQAQEALVMLDTRRQNLQNASPFPVTLQPSLPEAEKALLSEVVYQHTPSPPLLLADLQVPVPAPMQQVGEEERGGG